MSNHSTSKPAQKKPAKPEGSPLTVHPCGYFSKKIRGKVHYFARWDEGHEVALERYLAKKEALEAGRTPESEAPTDPAGKTLKLLLNEYVNKKRRDLQDGDIKGRTFEDCKETAAFLAKHLDKNRLVSDLRDTDFRKLEEVLRDKKRKGRDKSLVVLGNWITRIKQIFTWGVKKDFPLPKYGDEFDKPREELIEEQKQNHAEEHGERTFTPEEVRAMLEHATGALKTMILLAVNCGLGNSDIGQLRHAHIKGEWLEYPRPKNRRLRKCWLWPETRAALAEWLAIRPEPKDPTHDRFIFITKYGLLWRKQETGENSLSYEFRKLLNRIEVNGERGFYVLRHTYRTQAGNSKDIEAIFYTMGHAMPGMAKIYVHGVSEDRLRHVAEVVRRWLFGG